MTNDKRRCLGCGKPVPNRLRDKLTKKKWTFLTIKDLLGTTYYSNCGCMEHDDFVEECHIEHDEAVRR